MIYTDKCPVLSDTEWRDNCQFPAMLDGETPSEWKKRIWDQLMHYRNNNCLGGNKNCDQFVYVDKRVGYNSCLNYKMGEHWHTNCTRNKYGDISFKEYMELKQKPEVENDIFQAKKIRAVNIIAKKWLEYMYQPDGLCASELAQHYQLLWAI
ncbi:2339_t:CDS:2 [Cetraspora pellucida]|uniref:2339_t:CDS:1 n=1 Tax=Cetraspora pellucida TaxID=1433469 RepID=A0ACA9KGL6_9GLOM|nr:2339_t:CDS:2 [Cetraspora pellucida]